MAANKTKVVAGTVGVVCAVIVVGMGMYLPFYSSAAKSGEEARRQLHLKAGGKDHAPGGVWKNINRAVKHSKEEEAELLKADTSKDNKT